MSEGSKEEIREAWIAAPREGRSEGLSAVAEVEGERIVVVAGKSEVRRRAMTGVWDVPPERMTSSMSRMSRSALRTASSIRRVKPEKTLPPRSS